MVDHRHLPRSSTIPGLPLPARLAGALLALALLPAALAAETSGAVEGRALDVEQGRPLAGATVRLRGPLPRERAAVTGPDGRFRFPGLPPGTYELDARAEGFGRLEQSGIRVRLGHTVGLELEMWPAFDEDEVTLTGSAPVLDLTATTTGTVFDPPLLERMPTARTFDGPVQLAHEVQPGRRLALDLEGDPALAGGEPGENRWVLDGVETTRTASGGSAVTLPPEAVAQVEVATGGAGPEVRGTPGGVIRVHTRSGGAEPHATLFAYRRGSGLEVSTSATAGAGRDLGTDAWDLGAALGGPISRRNPWTFLALDTGRLGRQRSNRQGERFRDRRQTLAWTGRLTAQPAAGHLLGLSAFGELTDLTEVPLPDTAGRLSDDGEEEGRGAALEYSGALGRNLFFEARAGAFEETFEATPGADVALYEDLTSAAGFGAEAFWARSAGCGDPEPLGRGVAFAAGCRGGTAVRETGDGSRDELGGALTWAGTAAGREHAVRLGAQWRHTEVTDTSRDPGPVPGIFRDSAGTVVDPGGLTGQHWVLEDEVARLVELEGASLREADELALFVEDRIRLGAHLVLRLGLRAESLTARTGQDPGRLDRRFGFDLADAAAPRLGLVWDPRGNGLSRFIAYYGRYHDPLPPALDGRPFGGRRRNVYTFAYPRNGALPTAADPGALLDRVTLGSAIAADGDLAPGSTTELRLGYEVEILADLVAGVSLVQRRLEDAVEDISLDGGESFFLTRPGGTFTRDPVTGEALPAPVTVPRPQRTFEAVVMTFHKGLSGGVGGGWQLHGGYTWSRSEGNYGAPLPAAASPLAPGFDTRFDLPGLLAGARGPLPSERRHRFTAYGSYLWPGRLTTGLVLDYRSGAPISRLGAHPLLGRGERIIGRRGDAGRTPDLWSLDLHAEYPLELAAWTLHLVGDIFNVADRREAVRVDEEWTFAALPATTEAREPQTNPAFGRPLESQPPRTVRLGMRLSW